MLRYGIGFDRNGFEIITLDKEIAFTNSTTLLEFVDTLFFVRGATKLVGEWIVNEFENWKAQSRVIQ